eukprot:5593728-Prymnesium_polylepis.1
MGMHSSILGSTTSPAPRLITPSQGAGRLSLVAAAARPQPANAACLTIICESVSTLPACACVPEWPDTEGRDSEHTISGRRHADALPTKLRSATAGFAGTAPLVPSTGGPTPQLQHLSTAFPDGCARSECSRRSAERPPITDTPIVPEPLTPAGARCRRQAATPTSNRHPTRRCASERQKRGLAAASNTAAAEIARGVQSEAVQTRHREDWRRLRWVRCWTCSHTGAACCCR